MNEKSKSIWKKSWKGQKILFVLACLATLIALFYAEEDWRCWHAWNKFKRQWEAKGEKFDFASFVPPPVPDDQNFALTPIVASCYSYILDRNGHEITPRNTNVVDRLQMAVSHDDTKGLGNWQKSTASELQSPADDVLRALSKYDSVIEELRQASQMPYSRFPLEYDKDDPAAILLPHLAAMKRCSQVLQLRAIAELQDGQSEKALEDVKLSLSLMNSIHTEPFLISHLVRLAIFQITLQPVWEGLAEQKWSDPQLIELDRELAKLDFLADYEFSIRGGERAGHIKVIEWLEQRRSRPREFFRMIDNGQREVMNNFAVTAGFYLMPKGWFYQNDIVLAQMHQQWNLPAVDDEQQTVSPKKITQADKAIESINHPTPFNFFARVLLPRLDQAAEKFAYGQESAALARVAIALERYRLAHGVYPESLDALVPQFIGKIPHDIINGRPLNYRRTSDGQYVLYSVGWNETDDDGEVGLTKGGAVDVNTGDWVWRSPAK